MGWFFLYFHTHFSGYFYFFRITALVSTKCLSKNKKIRVIYCECFQKYIEKHVFFTYNWLCDPPYQKKFGGIAFSEPQRFSEFENYGSLGAGGGVGGCAENYLGR